MITANLLVWLTLAAPPPDEAFRSGVRPTEPLSPQDQQATFHLPPGFEIQLFAAEPDLQKPMNLAFDARGRLWVSGSVEYPYAAQGETGRDAIKILTDTDQDGRADRVETFVDGLNIPIGLYPYRDGVIAYSIPNIWFFRDTDGDGRADRREVLYGSLGTPRDTHGMQNAFRRGVDGWLYVNHGFANETEVRGRDGSSIRMQSGHTYRIRVDGSRVEPYTYGQVNPFGSVFLADGDLVTADCHSKPLTLLLRGAYYTSFGKPHDGLGFAPDLLTHDHGSTAICGVTQLVGDHFPEAFRSRLLVGNVMTSRLNQDELTYQGSSPKARELSDFLTSDDPWFRPVDVQLGPDGAIYVADFYNRIIGHYEVPLEHPGRDRQRGRIWRISYRGAGTKPVPPFRSLATAEVDELLESLGSSLPVVRQLAADQVVDRCGTAAVPSLHGALNRELSPEARCQVLWCLQRLGALTPAQLHPAMSSPEELVRVHAWRMAGETPEWTEGWTRRAAQALVRGTPREQRAVAEAAGLQSRQLMVESLVALRQAPEHDPFLRHTLRIAIRNQLRQVDAWPTATDQRLTVADRQMLAQVALGVATPRAAEFVTQALAATPITDPQAEAMVLYLASQTPAARLPELLVTVRSNWESRGDAQARLLLGMLQRISQRTPPLTAAEQDALREPTRAWGAEVARRLLTDHEAPPGGWLCLTDDNPWGIEPRQAADGTQQGFLSSLPGGEQRTSRLRSATFVIPPRLKLEICGHLGIPGRPPQPRNEVRLQLEGTGEVVQRALPPRNDVAQRVEWDLSRVAGQRGYLELEDGLDSSSYAWLAVARIEPPVVLIPEGAPPSLTDRQAGAALLAQTLGLTEMQESLQKLAGEQGASWRARQAAAQALLADGSRPLLSAMSAIVASGPVADSVREEILAAAVVRGESARDATLLEKVVQALPAREQRQVADQLATTAAGAEAFLRLIEQGRAASRLLQDANLRQKLAAQPLRDGTARVAAVLAALPPANTEIQRLMDEQRRAYRVALPHVERGREVFQKHCAACHQVRGQGALVGPQLDGIGNRGLERLLEDVLDPNRNVDAAFRATVVTTTGGQVLTGLFRREAGEQLILVDGQGKEFQVARADVAERQLSPLSLMPANVRELLRADEFVNLIGYLLSLSAPPPSRDSAPP